MACKGAKKYLADSVFRTITIEYIIKETLNYYYISLKSMDGVARKDQKYSDKYHYFDDFEQAKKWLISRLGYQAQYAQQALDKLNQDIENISKLKESDAEIAENKSGGE